MEWLPAVLAGASLLVSTVTLVAAMLILRAARRSEGAGDERLEILREQQQRLGYLNEERSELLDTLELLRRELGQSDRRREPPTTPPEPLRAPETAAEVPEEPRPTTGGA